MSNKKPKIPTKKPSAKESEIKNIRDKMNALDAELKQLIENKNAIEARINKIVSDKLVLTGYLQGLNYKEKKDAPNTH